MRSSDDIAPKASNKQKRDDNALPTDFYTYGKVVQNRTGKKLDSTISEERRFRDFFGVGVMTAVALWELLNNVDFLPDDGTILHMLWTLYFFKVYPKQGVLCSGVGGSKGAVDPKTAQKYIWPFVSAIAALEEVVIKFDDRIIDPCHDCYISVDGAYFCFPNHGCTFSLHKFKGKSGPCTKLAWAF
ncbi:hypothetical protein ACHAXS_004777 [Conticribra weissflogii]